MTGPSLFTRWRQRARPSAREIVSDQQFIGPVPPGLQRLTTGEVGGVPVLMIYALVIAIVGSLAGILVAAKIGTVSPDVGPPYLLPAFAACFLGTTQFKLGRFNVWGTVLALYLLATGVKGL